MPIPLRWVPRELIVRLTQGTSIDEFHATFGTSTIEELPQALTYLVATPAGMSLHDLINNMNYSSLCDYAEYNYLLDTPESEQHSLAIYEGDYDHENYVDQYALVRIGAAKAHASSTGSGVLVAVIDTGIDLDHPDLVDNLGAPGYDFIDGDWEPADLPNGTDDNGNGLIDEAAGHGSHVAGIIAAAAPGVVLLPLRVLNSDGTGTAFHVTRAIYYAIDAGAQVINLSLGLEARVDAMARAIQKARNVGVLVVASAGNRGIEDEDHFPASLPEVMAIAATNAFDRKALFSNYGHHISISAPGEGIMSTYWNGGYAIWSGTSMAAPFVAAAGAIRLAMEPLDPGDLRRLIEDTSFEINEGPYELGEGRVDLLALVQAPPQRRGPSSAVELLPGRTRDRP